MYVQCIDAKNNCVSVQVAASLPNAAMALGSQLLSRAAELLDSNTGEQQKGMQMSQFELGADMCECHKQLC